MKVNYSSKEKFLERISEDSELLEKIGLRIYRSNGDYGNITYYYLSGNINCCMCSKSGFPEIEDFVKESSLDSKIVDVKVGAACLGRIKITIDSFPEKSEAIYEFLRLAVLNKMQNHEWGCLAQLDCSYLNIGTGPFSVWIKVPGLTEDDAHKIISYASDGDLFEQINVSDTLSVVEKLSKTF